MVDWGQTLSFYNLTGKQIGKDRQLGFDPTSVNFFPSGDYLLIGGSGKQSVLYTTDGIFVGKVAEFDSWVWACKAQLNSQNLAIGCQDGTVGYYELGSLLILRLMLGKTKNICCRISNGT